MIYKIFKNSGFFLASIALVQLSFGVSIAHASKDKSMCEQKSGERIIAGMNEQKAEYCAAAEAADTTANANTFLLVPWAVALGVCVAACAFPIDGGTACTATNLTMTVVDLGVTISTAKEEAEKVQALTEAGTQTLATLMGPSLLGLDKAGPAVGDIVTQNGETLGTVTAVNGNGTLVVQPPPTQIDTSSIMGSEGDAPIAIESDPVTVNPADSGITVTKAPARSGAACFSAAMIAIKMALKGVQISGARKNADELYQKARELHETKADVADTINTPSATRVAAESVRSGATGLSRASVTNEKLSTLQSCNKTASSGNTDGVLKCAFALDSNLPSFVGSPKSNEIFKKLTGQDIGTMAKNAVENGVDASKLAGAIMSPGNTAAAEAYAAGLNQRVQQIALAQGEAGATYSGGGGAANSGKKADPFAGIQNLFGKLMGDGAGSAERAPGSANEIRFANINQDPDGATQDRRLSLFHRVSFRYWQNVKTGVVQPQAWASPYNRATAGAPSEARTPSAQNNRGLNLSR